MTKVKSTLPRFPDAPVSAHPTSWLPMLARLTAAGCCLAGLTWIGLLLSRAAPDESVIWLANGALLAFLLARPRGEWAWYLVLNFVTNTLVHVGFYYDTKAAILFSIINSIEVVLAAMLLLRKVRVYPDLSDPAILLRFGLYCVVAAPAVSALLASAVATVLDPGVSASFVKNYFVFFFADALGIAVMTPLILAIRPHQLERIVAQKKVLEALALLSLLTATTTAVFSQTRYPLIFLIYPLLLLIMFRLGRSGSGIAILLLAAPAIYFTLLSRGPFAMSRPAGLTTHIFLLQLFFFTLVAMMYGATATLSEQNRLSNDLQESEERYRILADHSWDIIVRTDLEGRRSYLSPSIFDVAGWTPDELIGKPSSDLIHPDDQKHHEQMWGQLTTNTTKLVYTYRMQTKDGSYLWVEAKARVVTDPATGLPREVVSVIRDVSARVDEQEQLMLAYRQAQVLAKIDTLTGLANRRGFDDALQGEWRRAIRDNTHLSLLMLDVDDFKSYNDVYGHPAGDACLQAIADALARSLQRSSDLAARYGGEEFAILLPNTPAAGASEIAERVRHAVAELYIGDERRVARPNTVSIGVAVAQPRVGGEQGELVGLADQALYAAKRNGKNQVVRSAAGAIVEVDAEEAVDGPANDWEQMDPAS